MRERCDPVLPRGGRERGYPAVRPNVSGSGGAGSRAATYRIADGRDTPVVAETPAGYGRDVAARARELDRQLRALASADGAGRRVLGLLADRFVSMRGFERLGFARLDDYAAERLGWSGRQLRDVVRVAVALAELPAMERALRAGTLGWSKARVLASVVSVADEERWLRVAASTDARTLAALTANARAARNEEYGVPGTGQPGARGERDTNPGNEAGADDDEEQEMVLLRIPCSRRAIRMWREAKRLAPRLLGRCVAQWQVAQAVAAEASSAPGRFAEVWEKEPWRSLASHEGHRPEAGAGAAVDDASCVRGDGGKETAVARAAGGGAAGGATAGGATAGGATAGGATAGGATAGGATAGGATAGGATAGGATAGGATAGGATAGGGIAADRRASAGRGPAKGTADNAGSDDLSVAASDDAVASASDHATADRRVVVDEQDAAAPADALDCPFERELENIESLGPRELDAAMRRVRELLQRRHAQLGAGLGIVLEARLCRDLGFSSFAAYVTGSLGIPERTARELARVARGANRSGPALATAWSCGELSWLQTLTLLPVAKTWNAAAWIRRAAEVTLRRLADEVDWALEQMEVDPQRAAAMPPPSDHDLARDRQMCADAASRADAGDPKSGPGATRANDAQDRQMCADATSANDAPRWSRDEFFGVLGRFRVTILAPRPVSRQFRSVMQAFAHPTEPRWLAFERMLEQVLLEWRRQPRHRDPVFERDDYRCTAPGCSSRSNLHDHHIVPRSMGGTNDIANRTTLCAWHHLRGIHGGLAAASGKAPDGIEWELGLSPDGPSFLHLRGDRYRRGREATG